jgi:uncharacterized membrane protein YsdA (DUF1294 family)
MHSNNSKFALYAIDRKNAQKDALTARKITV